MILAAALCIIFLPKKQADALPQGEETTYALSENQPEGTVERMEGERFFPAGENWVYHFTYAYPYVHGEELANIKIRETYQMMLDEWLELTLPMFANSPAEYYDGKNEVVHDFKVTCNNEKYLSILQSRSQTMGDQGTKMTLEALTFDKCGEYLGENLTLRGVVMVGESSEQIADAVMPLIWAEFEKLQQQGICRQDMDKKAFYNLYVPDYNFYTDENGNAVFFLMPEMLAVPSFDVPVFTFSPAELATLLEM